MILANKLRQELISTKSNWWNIVLNQIRRVEVSGLDVVVLFNYPTCFDFVTSLHQGLSVLSNSLSLSTLY